MWFSSLHLFAGTAHLKVSRKTQAFLPIILLISSTFQLYLLLIPRASYFSHYGSIRFLTSMISLLCYLIRKCHFCSKTHRNLLLESRKSTHKRFVEQYFSKLSLAGCYAEGFHDFQYPERSTGEILHGLWTLHRVTINYARKLFCAGRTVVVNAIHLSPTFVLSLHLVLILGSGGS